MSILSLSTLNMEAIMAEVFLVDILDEHLRNDGDVDQVCLWSDGSCSLRTVLNLGVLP